MAIPILECFIKQLPEYPSTQETLDAVKKHRVCKPTSKGTGAQIPPYLFILRDQDHHTEVGWKFINSEEARKSHELTQTYLEEEDPKGQLRMEQDAYRVDAIYLLHPVNKVINVKLNAKFLQQSEETQDSCRADPTFKLYGSDNDTENTIMIVEFKRQGLLMQEHSESAACSEAEKETFFNGLQAKNVEYSLELRQKPWYFIKQVIHYSVTFKCKYMALCDYQTLIIFHFDDGTKSAKMTVVSDADFRIAPLGVMIKACEDRVLT